MKAVATRRPQPISASDSLIDLDIARPEAGPRDILVEVRAISVNPVDTKVRANVDPGGQDKVLGWDAAGIVRAVGANVTRFRPGDEVFYAGSIDRAGSNAEFQVVDERIVGHKPRSLDFAHAAAMPLTSLTAWEMLFDRFHVPYGKAGEPQTLLIIGAAGGVGSMATQIAQRLTSLTVISTASRRETVDWVRKFGAHHVIDHRKPLSAQVKTIAPGGADYVMGLTQTDQHYPEIVELVAPEGHIGLIDDPNTALDITKLKGKSVALHWELMFTRSRFETPHMSRQGRILDEVADLVDAGVLKTTFGADFGTINAENLKRAHAVIESGKSIGKIVLSGF